MHMTLARSRAALAWATAAVASSSAFFSATRNSAARRAAVSSASYCLTFASSAGRRAAVAAGGRGPRVLLGRVRLAAGARAGGGMAAVGLGVDVRVFGRAGARVGAAAAISLPVLGGISLGLIRRLGVA